MDGTGGRNLAMLARLLLGLLLGSLALAKGEAMAIEEPRYDVTLRDGPFEIRDYAPTVVAATTVDGDSLSSASNEGFRRLAAYIFGRNAARPQAGGEAALPPVEARRSEKIAMTAPVGTTGSGGHWEITFAMPAARTLEDLPAPEDPRIALRRVPARRVASIRFSGTWRDTNVREHTVALFNWIAGQDLRRVGEPVLARYDPPWTLWFLRRNEILVEVEKP